MTVRRHGVFETNSSSCHSISIASGDYEPDRMPVVDGVVTIEPGEFGWEEAHYDDAMTKASYCLTWVMSGSDRGEALPVRKKHYDMLRFVIENVTGARVEFKRIGVPGHWSYGWGYIDHQSSDVCGPAFANAHTLRDFIFNERSTLRTDNDNH